MKLISLNFIVKWKLIFYHIYIISIFKTNLQNYFWIYLVIGKLIFLATNSVFLLKFDLLTFIVFDNFRAFYIYTYVYCYRNLHGGMGEKKRVLIDRARFATRRDSIVCPEEILKASTLSRYRICSIGSIFRAKHTRTAYIKYL